MHTLSRQDDPIGDLLSSKFPDAPRKPLLSVEHVSMDAEGLQKLVVSSLVLSDIHGLNPLLEVSPPSSLSPSLLPLPLPPSLPPAQLAGCYHAALELTSRFLSAHGQGLGQAGQPTMHTHKTLQVL